MKIGILYISIGNYAVFWKGFYKSAEKYLFADKDKYRKHYYVFTDQQELYAKDSPDVTVIYQKDLGWPGNTLYRFHMFLTQKEKLQQEDYLFFFNANLRFQKNVGEEFVSCGKNLIMVKSPVSYGKDMLEEFFEQNAKSTAYISEQRRDTYVAGGLNGGKTAAYIEMLEQLKENIDIDDQEGIVAVHHDETHLNRYFYACRDNVAVFGVEYLYPEFWVLPFSPKILLIDKGRYGGHKRMRSNSRVKLPTLQYIRSWFIWKILLMVRKRR